MLLKHVKFNIGCVVGWLQGVISTNIFKSTFLGAYKDRYLNSFMTEVPIIKKSVQSEWMDWFLYDRDLRRERIECQVKPNVASHVITSFYMKYQPHWDPMVNHFNNR